MNATSIDPVPPNFIPLLPVVRAVLTNAVLQYERLPEDARKKACRQGNPINPWVDTDDFIVSVLEQPRMAEVKVYKVFISEDCDAAEAVAAGAYLVEYRESDNKMWYAEIGSNPESDEYNVLTKEERYVFDVPFFD